MSSMPREKSRHRERRSSSYSSTSSYERKKSKSKHKRRSRSGGRSESSRKPRRSSSRSINRRRSYSRSVSKDRYESRSRKRSASRSRSKRNRSRSLSSSRSKSKYAKKKSKRSRSSSSRSSSLGIERPLTSVKINLDDTEVKLERAIKAAEAAGLTMTKIPTYEYKEVEIKEDMPTIHDRNLLTELNSDSFIQKSFTSSRNKKQSQNIVIDLDSQTVKVPETDIKVQKDESIINFHEIPPEDELKEMWIKKLYQYRKKMLRGDI